MQFVSWLMRFIEAWADRRDPEWAPTCDCESCEGYHR